MDVFDLYAKLSLDSSNYDRSLQNASSAADQWATKFVIGAKAVTSAFVGVGKMISGIASKAVDAFSSFEQLEGGVQTLFGTQGKSFEEWSASFSESSDSMQDYIDVARRVINGDFGVGAERRDLLAAAGYDPDTVQQMVNNLINGVDVATNVSADTIAANMQTAEEKYASLERAQAHAMENAQMAYATAGMSANEYMDTINSFAAGLISSLGGDTEKAVDVADMAVQDMSDNANKMGTNIASIQAAYQGFAKQNYTMLDNLKLGYGGTKTEMERLLKDAEKISGVKYDINNLADVYEAIHVVQTEMGITGTTAEEAAGTIEGSTKAVKAAWTNVLTSLVTGGEFFDKSIEALKETAVNFIHNIIPAFRSALNGVASLIKSIVPIIIEVVPELFDELAPGLIDAITAIIDSILDVLPSLLTSLSTIAPMVLKALGNFVPTILSFLMSAIPTFFSMGLDMLTSLITGFADNITTAVPELQTGLSNIVTKIIEIITTGGVSLLNAGVALLSALAGSLSTGLPSAATSLSTAVMDIIDAIVDTITKLDLKTLIDSAVTIVQAIADGITAAVSTVTAALPGIIKKITDWLGDHNNVSNLATGAVSIVTTLADAILTNVGTIVDALPGIVTGILGFFGNAENTKTLMSAANSILEKIGDGIPGAITKITEVLPQLITGIVGFLTNPDKLEALATGAIDMFATIVSDIPAILMALIKGLAGIVTGIANYFKTHGGEIKTSFKNMFTSLKGKITEAWTEKIKPAMEEFGTNLKDFFSQFEWGQTLIDFVGNITGFFSDIWSKIKDAFEGEEGLGAKLKNFFGSFDWGTTLTSFVTNIGTAFSTAWDTLKDVFDGVDGLASKIKGWIGDIDLGKSAAGLVESIKTGISGAWDSFKSWFTGLFDDLFSGVKIPSWLSWLFGGGDKGEGENGAEESESLVDMPTNMVTLDYDNLAPIPKDTLESYQFLANAIIAINNAITGGEGGEGLSAVLSGLPEVFSGVLTSITELSDYITGTFIGAIQMLTAEIAVITTDEEGNTEAGGGNTLYNALGSIQGELEDIFFDSQQLAAYWTGTFTGAIATLKDSIGEGQGALESMGAAVSGLTGQFTALVMAIQQVVAEYIAMNKILNGGDYSGGGGASKGNGIDMSDLFRASGGPVRGGQSYFVGEDGVEVFTPSRSGYIKPNSELSGAKGDTIINVTFEGDVIGNERSIRDLVGKAVKAGIRREVMAGV